MTANQRPEAWGWAIEMLRPVLLLAPRTYLDDVRKRLDLEGVRTAVQGGHTPIIFNWIVRLLARQGISNHAAEVFLARRGSPTFDEISALMATDARCTRLHGWWTFDGCGYRRSTASCGSSHHQLGCPVTSVPARKGALAEAAVGLWLFIRDCCSGDLVGWIDQRLATADLHFDDVHRVARMRAAVLEPLMEIPGTGPKTWAMVLAELLIGADPRRQRWTEVGASFIAIDSLLHNFLHRTGILRRLDASHAYGPRCVEPGGCVDVIAGLAARTDARDFNADFTAYFPRWVQFAIWMFCAGDGWSICNGLNIDDRTRCSQAFCPCFAACERVPLLGLSAFSGA